MKKTIKKVIAAAMALTLLGGLPLPTGGKSILSAPLTADAANSGIEVAGVKITADNCGDILGNGVFSYDETSGTLTVNGDYKDTEFDRILITADIPLTIVIAKDSTIKIPEASFVRSTSDITVKGDGKLTLECLDGFEVERGGNIEVRYTDLDIDTYLSAFKVYQESSSVVKPESTLNFIFSDIRIKGHENDTDNSTILGFDHYKFQHCYIKAPERFKYENHQLRTSSGGQLLDLTISPCFVPGDINQDGKFNLIDIVALTRYMVNVLPDNEDPDYIKRVGDIYNTGDGITNEDFMVLYAWWQNHGTPYYGAIPVLSFTLDENNGAFKDVKPTGEYLNTSRSTLRGAYLSLIDTPDEPVEAKWGDVSGDGAVKMNDAVLIMQSLSNADLFGLEGSEDTHITAKGQYYGDVESNGNGITPSDALQIQKYLIELVDSLEPDNSNDK
ncbi:MAG: hypothetical protein GXY08_08005 [Ruminococcus sp.]|nr:hypothetical protein [Ruminococcus sp.]